MRNLRFAVLAATAAAAAVIAGCGGGDDNNSSSSKSTTGNTAAKLSGSIDVWIMDPGSPAVQPIFQRRSATYRVLMPPNAPEPPAGSGERERIQLSACANQRTAAGLRN